MMPVSPRRRHFSFAFPEIVLYPPHPASVRGARRDRHEARGGERWPCERAVSFEGADERACADGQAVWAWHPGADASHQCASIVADATTHLRRAITGAMKPVPGESAEDAVKPSRRECRMFG